MYTGIWRRKLQERDHLEDLGIDGSSVLNNFLKRMGVDWIHIT
jgi:hypothetical protein